MPTTAFTLVTILVAFGYSQPSIAEITAKDIHGDWYSVAVILLPGLDSWVCAWHHIIPGNDVNTVHITDRFIQGRVHHSVIGVGRIENSTISMNYDNVIRKSAPYGMTNYRNGEDIIFHLNLTERHSYVLYFRNPAANNGTLKELRGIANLFKQKLVIRMKILTPKLSIREGEKKLQ